MALALGYAAAGFLLAGFSEAISPLVCVLLVIMWYRSRNRMYLAAMIGVVIGILIVATAPGNSVRAHLLPPRTDIMKAVTRLQKAMLQFLGNEVFNRTPALLLAFFIGYLSPPKITIIHRRLWAAILVPASLAAMAFTMFVPLYLAGGLEQRHFTTASLILVLSLFTLGLLCAGSPRLSSSS